MLCWHSGYGSVKQIKTGRGEIPAFFFWTAKIRQKFRPKYRILTVIVFIIISWPLDKIEKILM